MLRKLTTLFSVLVMFSSFSFGQWVNEGAWPDTALKGQLHGIAVDPDGKVWAGNFGTEQYLPEGASDTLTVRLIRVFNPDGSPADFSPIWQITVDGVTDTLGSNTRGMNTDADGNILITDGASNMYRINYQTGEGMDKVALSLGTSPTAPAVAENGNVFVGPVVNAASKIEEYTSDFTFLGDAVSFDSTGFSRVMEVSADGNTIYFPIYTQGNVFVYNRPSDLDPFSLTDSILTGFHCESMVWNPVTGHLWASAGSFNDRPDSGSGYSENTWYAYDFDSQSIVDSLKWEFVTQDDPGERPRGIAFSPDGNTAYIGCFGTSGLPLIQKVVNTGVGVEQEPNVVVSNYTLSQNYPNPFNPTTDIKFSVAKEGFVTLKVYDLLGKEVSTLVNEQMTSGSYVADFDASNLASGTYIYTLKVNGVSLSKKMMLLK